jgi:uncharacterized surface protein with fasciclin (FAS1) repeats
LLSITRKYLNKAGRHSCHLRDPNARSQRSQDVSKKLVEFFENQQKENIVNLRRAMTAAVLVIPFSLGALPATAQDIVDTAVSAGQFNTLVAAVSAADLVDTLKGDGPYTVFAPTDEAFAALPAGTLDNLLKPENKDQLAAILTYHVVSGKIMSADIAGQVSDVETVNGATLAVNATHGVTVNGANVVTADIETSNGVIHVIDAVVIPN